MQITWRRAMTAMGLTIALVVVGLLLFTVPLMEHPNIARIFDACATGTGRPYFVMESVKGIPMLREILDETASNLSQDLTNQPEVEVELRLTLARTYQDLGLYQQMESMARQSLEL